MDAVAAVVVAIALAALGFLDGATLDFDGSIIAAAAAADAVADVVTRGLDGAAGDGDCGLACSVRATADAGTIAAALRFYDGVAPDVDGSSAFAFVTAADAGAVLRGRRIDFGSAVDDDLGFAGSIATAANAGSIGGTDGFDVAACYLNGAGTTVAVIAAVPDAADASRGIAACGSQAAGVAAFVCSGCDGQFAGVAIALFVALEAGMLTAAGQLVVALQRDRRVALALDAEGGFTIVHIDPVVLAAGIDVDIVQRHVEGVVVARELVDDADDVFGEVIRRGLQDRVRFGLGRVVVIGAGVHDLAFRRRAVAGLGVVFLVAGGVVGRAGAALRAGVAAPRAGVAALRAGVAAPRAGVATLRVGALRVRASRAGVLAGLVLFRGLRLVFLAAVGGRRAAIGVGLLVVEVDHLFGGAVVF